MQVSKQQLELDMEKLNLKTESKKPSALLWMWSVFIKENLENTQD